MASVLLAPQVESYSILRHRQTGKPAAFRPSPVTSLFRRLYFNRGIPREAYVCYDPVLSRFACACLAGRELLAFGSQMRCCIAVPQTLHLSRPGSASACPEVRAPFEFRFTNVATRAIARFEPPGLFAGYLSSHHASCDLRWQHCEPTAAGTPYCNGFASACLAALALFFPGADVCFRGALVPTSSKRSQKGTRSGTYRGTQWVQRNGVNARILLALFR
jgi:hypothetical protein